MNTSCYPEHELSLRWYPTFFHNARRTYPLSCWDIQPRLKCWTLIAGSPQISLSLIVSERKWDTKASGTLRLVSFFWKGYPEIEAYRATAHYWNNGRTTYSPPPSGWQESISWWLELSRNCTRLQAAWAPLRSVITASQIPIPPGTGELQFRPSLSTSLASAWATPISLPSGNLPTSSVGKAPFTPLKGTIIPSWTTPTSYLSQRFHSLVLVATDYYHGWVRSDRKIAD